MIDLNTNPSRKDLRWFGLLLPLFLAVVGALLWWQFHAPRAARVAWIAAVVLPAAYWAVPALRRPLYLAWMFAAFPIGWTISHIVLAIVYYLVITPMGLAIRLSGRDPMKRAFDRGAPTYWVRHRAQRDAGRYFRQF